MKETRFIAQNKEKWLESETLLQSPVKDPEKLSNLFTQVVDDLSYSRTYYPNRSVRVYLNKIARQYFSIIYSHRQGKRNQFKSFWLDELPQVIIYCRKQLLVSLFVFLASFSIGAFSSYKDPRFVSTILGEDYVAMTKENIGKGDPMAVYKKMHQVDMFLGITVNNLMVAFRTYVSGIFLAIGSLALLLYNGIMVGCFQYFFVSQGLFVESALSIWLHGTLEISSIIIAGGAGLTLGSGLIFPGTYSRLQSFQRSAMRSLKLMLGVTPIFVLAAIIESFLTRYTDVPAFLKVVIILLSACLIVGYFVVFPWLKARRGFEVPLQETKLPPTNTETVNYTRIKNNAEILKDTFVFYSRQSAQLLPWVVVVSLASATASFFLKTVDPLLLITGTWQQALFGDVTYALETPTPVFILVNTVCTSLVLYRAMQLIDADATKTSSSWNIKTLIQLMLLSAVVYGLIYLGSWGIFFAVCIFGFLLLAAFTQLTEKSNLLYGLAKGWSLLRAGARHTFETQVMLLLLCFSFLLVLSAPLVYMYTEAVRWNFAASDVWATNSIRFLEVFIKTFSFYLVVPILAASTAYLYFTLEEIESATSLKASIARVGTRVSRSKR